MSSRTPDPQATGRLARTPFVNLVLYLQARGMDGTLVVGEAAAQVRVLFAGGRPTAIFTKRPATNLESALLTLAELQDAAFAFYALDLVSDQAHGVCHGQVDPQALVVAAARERVPDQVVDATLEPYAGVPLCLEPRADLARLHLSRQELGTVELLAATPLDLASIAAQSPLALQRVRRLCYALLITKTVQPVGSTPATSGSQTRMRAVVPPADPTPRRDSAPAMPASRAPVPAWKQLGARARSSLPPAPRHRSAPVPRALEPRARAESPHELLLRAERHSERHEHEAALEIVDGILSAAPNDPDAHAMRAWVLFHSTPTDQDLPVELAISLRKALNHDSDQPRALFLRALLLKRDGRPADALRYFRRVLSVDVRVLRAEDKLRIDAERELRVALIRRRSGKSRK